MVMQPKHLQHADIQKSNLSITKLEEVTWEALHNFFGDKENPSQGAKKPYLKEIFKIARSEERFRNGEIGKKTRPFNQQGRFPGLRLSCRWRL
jgi:hypothetical protein